MAGRSDLHDVPVKVRWHTDAAWCIANPEPGKPDIWIPKSQCEIERGEAPNEADILTAPEWLLIEKGLV